ncbi:hypothetical protein B0T22DRAFT_447985 [Podospora appendiculata]|uniref:Uncharacterized protein n=1 Tax=Podospora appendiculata TaxID=314037 RepID=A0AAE0XG25_9PEZI|nr:hypothetical protein B0T22DRAFT_447985 [Podospora appendiculata]
MGLAPLRLRLSLGMFAYLSDIPFVTSSSIILQAIGKQWGWHPYALDCLSGMFGYLSDTPFFTSSSIFLKAMGLAPWRLRLPLSGMFGYLSDTPFFTSSIILKATELAPLRL